MSVRKNFFVELRLDSGCVSVSVLCLVCVSGSV